MLIATPAFALDKAESKIVATVDAEVQRHESLLEKLVNVNSGTMNFAGVEEVGRMMRAELEPLGFTVRWVPMKAAGRAGHLIAEHPAKNGKRMLLIGHLDTVFELSSPFQKFARLPNKEGWAEGPGGDDMKGGLVVIVAAMRAMQAAGVLKDASVNIVMTGDEEKVGNPQTVARADLIAAGHASDVALDFEGLARKDGKDMGSIARRSASSWTVTATAKSGHSSGIFSKDVGAGAAYELARILDEFRQELPEPSLTFNVGLILAGSNAELNADGTGGAANGKSNVIPPIAIAKGDMRTMSNEQTTRVRNKMKAIVEKHLPLTNAQISFDEGYPAMAPTEGSRALLGKLNAINKDLGLPQMGELDPLERGAGDIAFVSDLVPGLVGMGAAGEGSHAPGKTVDLRSLPLQAKRAALLMYRLSKEKR